MAQSGKQKTLPPTRSVADKPEYQPLLQPPLSAFDDNPVFDEKGAATILGLSQQQLTKWRQRNFGPDFIQYGPKGPRTILFHALMDFRATHTVNTGRKK